MTAGSYTRMNAVVPDNCGNVVMLWLCRDCGAMVGSTAKHDVWHDHITTGEHQ